MIITDVIHLPAAAYSLERQLIVPGAKCTRRYLQHNASPVAQPLFAKVIARKDLLTPLCMQFHAELRISVSWLELDFEPGDLSLMRKHELRSRSFAAQHARQKS